MGASEGLLRIVEDGLKRCRGTRIVIGNGCREYNRLGAFSMENQKMGNTRKKTGENAAAAEAKKTSPDGSENPTGQAQAKKKKSPAKMMHRMRRMVLMMGTAIPVGMMKDMKNLFLLIDYWQAATPEDIASFMLLLLRQYFHRKGLPKEQPCTLKYGIYLKNPLDAFTTSSLNTYWRTQKFDRKKETTALLFYGHSYPNDFMPVVRMLWEKLSLKYNVLPIAFSQNEDKDLKTLEKYLCQEKYPVSFVINLMPFRLGAGPMGGDANGAVDILKKLNVPYFKPLCITKTDRQEWMCDSAVNPGEFLISILLPELDGGIHTYPVGILENVHPENLCSDNGYPGKNNGLTVTGIAPIAERIDSLCRRADRFVALQKMQNSEKKIALICYNYPPGEDNLFGGAFLDTFASLSEILKGLQEAGYQADVLTPETLKEIFLQDGMCNEPDWADEKASPYSIEISGKVCPVKGIRLGNVFIGLQPSRLEEGNEGHMDEGAYHDKNTAPPLKYQAFYRFLQKKFQTDAILHIGTHGTLEFLPGKENGMTGDCWPDRLIGDIPHFYFYYMGNPSEAMTAKRRSHAALISYAPPEFEESGLYGGYAGLKSLIAEYRESAQSAPEKCTDLLDAIEAKASDLKLWICKTPDKNSGSGDIEKNRSTLTEKDLDRLDDMLYDLEISLIPKGLHVIGQDNADEIRGMLRALRGEYLPVGIAGDILKNPDILPAGRNLVQFDPRRVPTMTAYQRGARAAKELMAHYKEAHGEYPKTTAVIVWGLETSKTQGETIGQILYYLGVRLKEEEESFTNRFEIIPAEELNRPRVDVLIHICGFFRDMYPNLIDNLNEIFYRLDRLNEPDAVSAFAKNTREKYRKLQQAGTPPEEAAELARSRIFGPAAGEYGTGLRKAVHNGTWNDESELGNIFTADLSYVYSTGKKGEAAKALLSMSYTNVEMISQIRNNVEYELIDLDHYYEFYGGLSRAVENVRGKKADQYVVDTVGEKVRTMDLKTSIEHGVRTRLFNPKWIEQMMRHDYHGVQQIAKRFENVTGLAASTGQVSSGIFSEMERCYIENEELRKQMQQSNRWAYIKMIERLMEAKNRGYWDASAEEISALQQAYLETESELEH